MQRLRMLLETLQNIDVHHGLGALQVRMAHICLEAVVVATLCRSSRHGSRWQQGSAGNCTVRVLHNSNFDTADIANRQASRGARVMELGPSTRCQSFRRYRQTPREAPQRRQAPHQTPRETPRHRRTPRQPPREAP